VKQIPLSRGMVALVDDADYERVIDAGPWTAKPHCRTIYAQRHFRLADGRRTVRKLHTFLTGWPLVDHRNGNGLDNQRSNLRPATPAQSVANRRVSKNSTSGFKGIALDKRRNRWQARIRFSGGSRGLGYHDTAEAAARAYDAAARELFGEFARPNFEETH
jgi:AP2 domain